MEDFSENHVWIRSFTLRGAALGERIARALRESGMEAEHTRSGESLTEYTEKHFQKGDVLVFIGACGIAVRAIAPFVSDKSTDPAVLSVDEAGMHVISLLSGHLGGANAWAERIAGMIGAHAVISTATDLNGLFAVDVFAGKNGLGIPDPEGIRLFSAGLLEAGEGTVGVPETLCDRIRFEDCQACGIRISQRKDSLPHCCISPYADADCTVQLVPRCLVAGMGCRKGVPAEALLGFLREVLEENGLREDALCTVATIDRKKDEPGLNQLCAELNLPMSVYSAEILGMQEGHFSDSERVAEAVGVGNVCERACAAAGADRILVPKTARNGMTAAIGIRDILLRLSRGNPSQNSRETGNGLWVVGIGPGSMDGMTREAWNILECSDCIVGYAKYIDLIRPVFPGKDYLSTPMTKEEERCRLALERAKKERVSLISSGDPGIYGLAGLALTISEQYPDVPVRVIPGVTAASSGAALLGAPLTQDFAVISLSDRLTSWETIEKRLRSAAEADLGIVLYNPCSKGRPDSLSRAAEILIEILPGRIPVGIADRIGREGEQVRILTLEELPEAHADMFSTVFIGNSRTRVIDGKMITPRGYLYERQK